MSPVGGVLGAYDPASVGALGTLSGGYAQITANQASITTQVDVSGLSVTVIVGSGRRICVEAKALIGSSVVNDQFILYLMEGATQLWQDQDTQAGATATVPSLNPKVILTPTAGSHTYKVQAKLGAGTGTVTVFASSTFPAWIHVTDVGT